MNTNVKVGIAVAIVAALVALIVLDQKTTPGDTASSPPPDPNSVTLVPTADPAGQRVKDNEIDTILKRAEADFNKTLEAKPVPAKSAIKQGEERNQKDIKPVGGDEYVIKEKDTLDTIAQAKYGSKRYATLIVEANPNLKPTSLRIGRKIVLPAMPVKADVAVTPPVESAPVVVAETPKEVVAAAAPKTYTVAQGDSLMVVSQKVYGTARHYKKVYEANKDKITDPNNLLIGLTLNMPEITASTTGTIPTAVTVNSGAPAEAPAGGKIHAVAAQESLWKIAEKYAPEKGKGVLQMMKEIVAANSDKMKDEGTMLRLGWQLIIPE